MAEFMNKLESLWHSAERAEKSGMLEEAERILSDAISLCVAHGDIECVIAAYERMAVMLERQNRTADAEAARKMTYVLKNQRAQ
jgi:hypothetical protein